jgi:hypothetical protein
VHEFIEGGYITSSYKWGKAFCVARRTTRVAGILVVRSSHKCVAVDAIDRQAAHSELATYRSHLLQKYMSGCVRGKQRMLARRYSFVVAPGETAFSDAMRDEYILP